MGEFRVDLAAFQGPLDLLLHLVQQEEVDIHEVPLARIADRFLEIVRGHVDTLDVDEAGEYLVLASQLLLLKSRSLLPRDTPVDLDEIDPRLDLVRQLLEYRAFKQVAGALGERAASERNHFPVRAHGPDPRPLEEEELEVDLFGLVEAFQRLLRETGADETVAMPRERLPITHFVGILFDRLTEAGGHVSFADLVGERPDRTYVIGAFLALLELIKLRKVLVRQDGFGEIRIQVREEALEPDATADRDLVEAAIDEPDLREGRRTRVVLMGGGEFGVPLLHSLLGAGFPPVLVVAPPPQAPEAGHRRRESPLAAEAAKGDHPLHRTSDVNTRTSRDAIQEATPDVLLVAGFEQALGSALLDLPTRGCLNLHPSLLPRHRGEDAVAAALREGATEVGVTLHVMTEERDAGPIVAQQTLPLTGEETRDEVLGALAALGADLVVRALPAFLAGEIELRPQDPALATYAPRPHADAARIPWSRSALEVKNHVRAVTSTPGAQSAWQPGVRHEPTPVVVLAACVLEAGEVPAAAAAPAAPGVVLAAGPEGIDVACGEGAIRILRLQPAGERAMDARAFLARCRVVAGDRFL